MALRSVVLEPPASPAAPRRTVLLRAGAPAPRGGFWDIVLGVLGALLLVTAIVLASVLPEKTVLDPQFRLSFPEIPGEGNGTDHFDFVEGAAELHDFVYDIPDDNVKSITVEVRFEDDIAYSKPDIFSFQLIAPNGTLVGAVNDIQNPVPKAGRNATDNPTSSPGYARASFPTAPTFSEEIVTGLKGEKAPQAEARLAPQYHRDTAGQWTVRVTMSAAQDCPDLNEEGTYTAQYIDCRIARPSQPAERVATNGLDLGNRFFVLNVFWSAYTPTIEDL